MNENSGSKYLNRCQVERLQCNGVALESVTPKAIRRYSEFVQTFPFLSRRTEVNRLVRI